MRKICKNCVMDESDPLITFDERGICNHCKEFKKLINSEWFPNQAGERKLHDLLKQVKFVGRGKQYDCVVGLSGGVDSSYLCFLMKKWNLRPLLVHVDAGWNSELAVSNIQSIVEYTDFDLETIVINWKEVRELQVAYLKSGISNQDVPQDHIFFASLYEHATKNGIEYIFSGGNIASEGVFPSAWHGSAMDAKNLVSINERFGTTKLKEYKTASFFDLYVKYPFFFRLKTVRPLNLMDYNKFKAIRELEKSSNWRSYETKHGESVFTKLFQNYILPTRFGYDKRRPHLSSLINSGQISRTEALAKLSHPLYDNEDLKRDIAYFCKKLRISQKDFESYMNLPLSQYSEFDNWDRYFKIMKLAQTFMRRVLRLDVRNYS